MFAATDDRMLPGFADPVHQSQQVFTAVMQATARPGRVHEIGRDVEVPGMLHPATGAILLALADFDTPAWLDGDLAGDTVRQWLQLHTGAQITDSRENAAFVVAAGFDSLPVLATLALGTPEYPDRSATAIVQVDNLEAGAGWTLTGPGIEHEHRLACSPAPTGFAAAWAANRDRFPLGVDIILCAPQTVACLPRTVEIREG